MSGAYLYSPCMASWCTLHIDKALKKVVAHKKTHTYHSANNRPTQLLLHFSTLVLHKPITPFPEIGGLHLLCPFRGKYFMQ